MQGARDQEARVDCRAFLDEMRDALKTELMVDDDKIKVDTCNVTKRYSVVVKRGDALVALSCFGSERRFYAKAIASVLTDNNDVLTVEAEGDDPVAALRKLRDEAARAVVAYARAMLSLLRAMAREVSRTKDPEKARVALKIIETYVWLARISLAELAELLRLDSTGATYKMERTLDKVGDVGSKLLKVAVGGG